MQELLAQNISGWSAYTEIVDGESGPDIRRNRTRGRFATFEQKKVQ